MIISMAGCGTVVTQLPTRVAAVLQYTNDMMACHLYIDYSNLRYRVKRTGPFCLENHFMLPIWFLVPG